MSFDHLVYLGMPGTGSDRASTMLARWARSHRVLAGAELLGTEPLGPTDAAGLRPQAAELLGEALERAGARAASVVLPVLRQDRLMEHAHLHEVRNGSAVPFAKQFPYAGQPVLDWCDLAARVRAVPGVAQLTVVPVEVFDVDGATSEELGFDQLGFSDPAGDLILSLDPPSSTYSARGIRVARALNAHLETEAERDLVRDFVAETFPGPPGPNLFLSAATRARVVEAYAEANRRLFRDWLPGYPSGAWIDA